MRLEFRERGLLPHRGPEHAKRDGALDRRRQVILDDKQATLGISVSCGWD